MNDEISRTGYFARVSAIDTLIQRFLACEPGDSKEADSGGIFALAKKQIVSLGAGQDTTFFKLAVRT